MTTTANVLIGAAFVVGFGDPIANAGRRGDQINFKFALEALLDYLEMQQAEEAAAEAEAKGNGVFRLKAEGAVVEPQLLERIAKPAVLVRLSIPTPRSNAAVGPTRGAPHVLVASGRN